jgi:hypothetical protein
VRAGVTLEAAARTVGVSDRTVRRWRRAGDLDLAQALAESELALGAVVAWSAPRSWRAAAFLLERQFPERWALAPRRSPGGGPAPRQGRADRLFGRVRAGH